MSIGSKSRYLASLLRHHKNPLGVPMDPRGWVNLESLVKRWCEVTTRHSQQTTVEELIHIVMLDNKSRFSVSEDSTLIRANQGHSIDIALDAFTQIVPPPQLFHGTSIHALPGIRDTGITKQDRHHVHLSREATTAYRVGMRHRGNAYIEAVVLGIDARKMFQDGIRFYISDNGVFLVDHIEFKYIYDIQILRKGKPWHCSVEEALREEAAGTEFLKTQGA